MLSAKNKVRSAAWTRELKTTTTTTPLVSPCAGERQDDIMQPYLSEKDQRAWHWAWTWGHRSRESFWVSGMCLPRKFQWHPTSFLHANHDRLPLKHSQESGKGHRRGNEARERAKDKSGPSALHTHLEGESHATGSHSCCITQAECKWQTISVSVYATCSQPLHISTPRPAFESASEGGELGLIMWPLFFIYLF